MKVVILAGGFGTRLSEETEMKPLDAVLWVKNDDRQKQNCSKQDQDSNLEKRKAQVCEVLPAYCYEPVAKGGQYNQQISFHGRFTQLIPLRFVVRGSSKDNFQPRSNIYSLSLFRH